MEESKGGLEHKVGHEPAAKPAHDKTGINPNYLGLAGLAASAFMFAANPYLGIAGLVATYLMAYGKNPQPKESH
jgi:hypothetical protein